MWVAWSADGGTTWDDGGGIVPGSAATAYEVDSGNAAETDLFPTIAAGKPGTVDVSWLHTNEIEPTDALGKFLPGGWAGPGNGNPSLLSPGLQLEPLCRAVAEPHVAHGHRDLDDGGDHDDADACR
jgi:hypothetical protein